MKNFVSHFVKKYPRAVAGIWFMGFGCVAFLIVNYFLPSSDSLALAPVIASFVSGFALGRGLIVSAMSDLKAASLGMLIGVFAIYLFLIQNLLYEAVDVIEGIKMVITAIPAIFMVLLLPPAGVIILAMGGLGGWGLRQAAKRMGL